MRRLSPAALCWFLSAAAHAAVDDGRASRFIGFHGGAGTGALLGYESTSMFAWESGPTAGRPLHVSYASAIRGGTAAGFGMVIGGRRGRASGAIELSYAVVRTREQNATFEREGSTYDPVNGYVPLTSGPTRLPAGWLRVSSSSLIVGFDVAPWKIALAPYMGMGLGVMVMHASSGWLQGEDGKPLDEFDAGVGAHVTLGVRAAPGEAFFCWAEFRPGWHLMSPYVRGTDWSRTRDEFVMQWMQVLLGIGWQWE